MHIATPSLLRRMARPLTAVAAALAMAGIVAASGTYDESIPTCHDTVAAGYDATAFISSDNKVVTYFNNLDFGPVYRNYSTSGSPDEALIFNDPLAVQSRTTDAYVWSRGGTGQFITMFTDFQGVLVRHPCATRHIA